MHAEGARLAVYLDYLWFDPHRDSIMNIEPGILMLYRSRDALPALAQSIVHLLHAAQRDYLPAVRAQVKSHMNQALHTALSKKVIV
jgi:integrator complex subunit 3